MSYNVHGLENKILYPDFFNYVKSFDVVALLETHVCLEKISHFNKYFGEFDLCWKPATRNSVYGRGIGGCLIGVKKNLNRSGVKHTFKSDRGIDFVKINLKSMEFSLIPLYLRAATWNDDFRTLEVFCKESDLVNPIVMGDLNVRIGQLQNNIDEAINATFAAGMAERKSKDNITNSKGKEFMQFCYDYGLIVANGMTKGDEDGEFTFASGVGSSVNDVCAVSQDFLKNVFEFNVDNKTWSDHFPIVLTLRIKLDPVNNNGTNMLPKLIWQNNKLSEYQNKVREMLRVERQNDPLEFGDIVKIIKEASRSEYKECMRYPKEQKWFNTKCLYARKTSFELLAKYRQVDSAGNRENYTKANQRYKEICKQAKYMYYQILDHKIETVKDSNDWWKIVREIRNDDEFSIIPIHVEDLRTYFQELLNPQQSHKDIQYAHPLYTDDDLDKTISVMEVKEVLEKAKLNKAPGEDRIPYEFFKYAPEELLNEIAKSCNTLLENGKVDDTFVKSVIFPIHKKGDNTVPNNYRGISFMNCLAKIMMGLITERLSRWIERKKKLNEFQAGFRKNYSTSDNIYNLSAIVHLNFHKNKKTFAFFVDFKAAFDKVPRKALIYKLYAMGVSTKLVKFIEHIYEDTKFVVWNGKELSTEFATSSGVKQGCLLSPLLFAIYLNDLHEFLGGGTNVDELNIRLLLYADDIVILADDSAILQHMIYKLEEYCRLWCVEVNLNKSQIMVFRKGGKIAASEKWYFNGNEIKITPEYCYLGVTLTPRMSFTKHVENRNLAAKNSINVTWNNFLRKPNISLNSKWKLFLAVCRAVQTYAAQVWGYSYFELVDKLSQYFVKKILKLPNFTPTYALMLETGIENGHLFTLDLHLRYVSRALFDYNEERLPHQLSKKILNRQIFWVNELNTLSSEHGIIWSEDNVNKSQWFTNKNNLLQALRVKYNENFLSKTRQTTRIYKQLEPGVGQHYIIEANKQEVITWIFKARTDLIELNGNRFAPSASTLCSLCNMHETENIQHFLGRCPALREFRILYFNKVLLEENDIVNLLNGFIIEWKTLANYIKSCIQYRKYLIEEFNF